MVAAGSIETLPTSRWKQVTVFECLGRRIQNDGGIHACWQSAKSGLWRSFWGNAACTDCSHLPLSLKLKLLKRFTAPALHFRCSRWPPQKHIAREVDITQRKMVSILLQARPLSGESAIDFCKRRGRIATRTCKQLGMWTRTWFTRAVRWDDHIRRPRNSYSWSTALVKWRGKPWLQARRAERGTPCTAGKTGTRASPDRVRQRWDSGIALARLAM